MNTYTVFMVFAMAVAISAEPPTSYGAPSGGGGGYIGGGGGGFGGGGGGYVAEPSGYQTNEGAHVDQALLEQVRQILLKEEASAGAGGHGGGGGISSSYGVPSSSYGAPSYQSRVVGIDLEAIKQAIQVAQFRQTTHQAIGGYPSGPSSSYGAPRAPSGSYGAPF